MSFYIFCFVPGGRERGGEARSFGILTDSECRKYTGAQDITYACLSDLPSRLGPLETGNYAIVDGTEANSDCTVIVQTLSTCMLPIDFITLSSFV